MKKIFKALLNAVVLSAVLLSLTACNDSSADAAASEKNGAAPYELTEDERALLSALGITDMNSLILTFRAPAGTEELPAAHGLLFLLCAAHHRLCVHDALAHHPHHPA